MLQLSEALLRCTSKNPSKVGGNIMSWISMRMVKGVWWMVHVEPSTLLKPSKHTIDGKNPSGFDISHVTSPDSQEKNLDSRDTHHCRIVASIVLLFFGSNFRSSPNPVTIYYHQKRSGLDSPPNLIEKNWIPHQILKILVVLTDTLHMGVSKNRGTPKWMNL